MLIRGSGRLAQALAVNECFHSHFVILVSRTCSVELSFSRGGCGARREGQSARRRGLRGGFKFLKGTLRRVQTQQAVLAKSGTERVLFDSSIVRPLLRGRRLLIPVHRKGQRQ